MDGEPGPDGLVPIKIFTPDNPYVLDPPCGCGDDDEPDEDEELDNISDDDLS